MRNIIVLRPLCGLCNRMQAIVSLLKIAKIQNRKCIVVWMVEPGLNAKMSDIFEDLPFPVITVKYGGWKYSILNNILRKIFYYVDDYDDFGLFVGANYERWCSKLPKLRPLYICTGQAVYGNITGYEIFVPNNDILRLSNNLVDESFIGIHIRRTDNIWSREASPTDLFVDVIKKELSVNPSALFYLATDDTEEEHHLISSFADHIICYKKRSLSRDAIEGIQDAVVDLYNLSRCKKIYGSYKSSFSNVASLWGNTELIIVSNNK